MKKTFEQVSEVVDALWKEYVESDIGTVEETEFAVCLVLRDAGWTTEEYDAEVIARSVDEPGCRLAIERNCNA